MTVYKHKFFKAAVFGLATLGAAGSAGAQSITEVYTSPTSEHVAVTVTLRDLDLASPSGQETLHRRLNAAARQVCGSSQPHRAGSVKHAARNEECQEAAVSRAMARINRTAVAAR